MSTSRRIAQNTLILYCRLLLTVGVTLYSIRIVLSELGVDDYGTYTVVGGVVALLSFLPASMASATQRYFAFALGEKDEEKLHVTFTVNWVLYTGIAIVALLVLESLGLWYVKEHLRVPAERIDSVLVLYHLSVLAFMVSILTAPFMAILIAHEDMRIYAYVSIIDALLRLLAALSLIFIAGDKLVVYGVMLVVAAMITTILYIWICIKKYTECQFRVFHWDKNLLKEVLGFTGWTLFGQLTTVVRNHAVTILLNQVFNPAVVAARAIALQIGNQTNLFSANFNTSLYPPIIKSWAAGKKGEMFSLVFTGSKITFFSNVVAGFTAIHRDGRGTYTVAEKSPEDALLFARLALVEALITSVSLPLMTAARASGRVQLYELTLGMMQLAIFPLSWLAVEIWRQPWMVFAIAIAVNCLMFVARLLIVKRLVGLPVTSFFIKVILPSGLVVSVSAAISFGVSWLLPVGLLYSVLVIGLSLGISGICIYCFGLDAIWRLKLRNFIMQRIFGNRSVA